MVCLEPWFSNYSGHQNHLESLYWFLGPTPRVSGSVSVKWGMRICISTKFPSDTNAAPLETTENHWLS